MQTVYASPSFGHLRYLLAPAIVLIGVGGLCAQNTLPSPAAASPAARPAPRFRKLAPGVEKTIPADRGAAEQLSLHNLDELLAVDPAFGERPGTEG